MRITKEQFIAVAKQLNRMYFDKMIHFGPPKPFEQRALEMYGETFTPEKTDEALWALGHIYPLPIVMSVMILYLGYSDN